MKNKNKIVILILAFVLALPVHTSMVLAQEPFQRNIVITGYYSPIPDQRYYVKGSLAADKILNGNGTHGASGRPVFQGMIAAPKDYPFGTKIYIPGLGVGTVADRGGAIISNYKDQIFCKNGDLECDRTDRLDLWMGHGDSGLARALYQIGVKRAVATIYPPGTGDEMVDSIVYADVDVNNLPKGYYPATKIVTGGISDSVKNETVQTLKVLGYHDGSEDKFDEDVYRFQINNGIVLNRDESGAGHLGPKTRDTLKERLEEFYASVKTQTPEKSMGRGTSGAEVSALQEALKKLGHYNDEITGKYDNKTINAIYEFQKSKELVDGENDSGAGYYGNKTREELEKVLTIHERVMRKSALDTEFPHETKSATHSSISEIEKLLNTDLSKYDEGENVYKLQEFLGELGYLDHEPTGYFGNLTTQAVISFQKAKGIVTDDYEVGAGRLGPTTRAELASVVKANTKLVVNKKVMATTVVGVARRPKAKIEATDELLPEEA